MFIGKGWRVRGSYVSALAKVLVSVCEMAGFAHLTVSVLEVATDGCLELLHF